MKVVSLRLNDNEHFHIQAEADAASLSIGRYCKAKIFSNSQVDLTAQSEASSANHAVARQVAYVGNNLNQIARALNRAALEGNLGNANYAAIQAELARIADILDLIDALAE